MATAQEDYEKLLRAYLASADAYKPLAKLVQSLEIKDLLACITTYFLVTRDYDARDKQSLNAFYDLLTATLTKGDVYDALRVDSLAQKSDTLWHNRYSALNSTSRNRLAAQVKRQRASLTPTQRDFLRLFAAHMNNPDQKAMEKFVDALKFPPLYDCLLAYIEVSQQYDDTNENSLVVFYGMSFRALGQGDSYFAAQYESRVQSDGSVWKRRYDALKSWQRETNLVPAIKEGKQIVSVTKYHGKDVTEKHPISVTIPREPAQPEDQLRNQPQTTVQREFVEEFHKFMARQGTEKRNQQFKDSMARRSFDELQQCVYAYLQASTRYPDDDKRSLIIFFSVASAAVSNGDAYYTFKFKLNIERPGTLAKRYAALDADQKKILNDKTKKKENRARILDDIKFAYFQNHQKDPDLQSLRDFQMPVSDEQALTLSKILEKCDHAFASHAIPDFLAAFDALSELLKAQRDLLQTFGLLQRCTRATGVAPGLGHQLRWYMTGALYIKVLVWHPEVYKRGLDKEERSFFFDNSDQGNAYFNDFALRLDYLWMRYQSHAQFTQISKANILLHLFAGGFGMSLVPFEEAAAVHALVEILNKKRPDFIEKVRIPINSRYSPGKTLRINETIDKIFIVWWDPNGSGDAYVEIEGFEGILFGADAYWRLGKACDDDATYGEIYRSTKHILTVMPIFFEFLGYLPDLVTGGLSGLVKSFVFNLALEKTAQVLGVDSTVGQLVLLGAGMLAHHAIPGKKQPALSSLEADATAVESRGVRRLQADTGTTNRHIDNPSLSSDGLADRHLPSDPTAGPDMRGIKKAGGHEIRGEHDVPADISTGATNPQTEATVVMADGVSGKGTSSRGTPEPPVPVATRQDLVFAEQHLKETKSNFELARTEMDQRQKRVGDLEANVEEAQGKRYLADREKELKVAQEAERASVKKYRERGWELRAAESKVERLRSDLARRGELAKSLGDRWNLPDTPTSFRRGNVEVESWRSDAYIGTTDDRVRYERLLNEDPGGDLSKHLIDNKGKLFPANVGNMSYWEAHPEAMELAHVLSKREGGRDVYILMTKARNQRFSALQERTGGVFKDETIVIQGIAIDRMSALDLVKKGLPQSVIDRAPVIKF